METEKYSTGLKRIWAAIVDGIVFMPFLLIDYFLISPATNEYIRICWLLFTVFTPIFYSIILHYNYGQTIGKWVVGIKVMDVTETKNISFKQSVIRDSFYLFIELIAFLYFLVQLFKTGKTSYLLEDFNSFGGIPFLVWTLLELATMLLNKKRRAIHDFLARSVVIRTQ
jgi:uncharacterized RDD family membrane protein YckC